MHHQLNKVIESDFLRKRIDDSINNKMKRGRVVIFTGRYALFLWICLVVGLTAFPDTQCSSTFAALKNKKILFCYCNPTVGLVKNSKEQISKQSSRLRGSAVHKINQYKKLIDSGLDVVLFVVNDKEFAQEVVAMGSPCYSYTIKQSLENSLTELTSFFEDVCSKEKIDLIHCRLPMEVMAAARVKHKFPVKIMMTLHTDAVARRASCLKHLDGALGVGPKTVEIIYKTMSENSFAIKNIDWIAPIFDEEKFLSFAPTIDKKTFFKREFGINLKDCPLICSIANFYPGFKNHKVLLHAVHKLLRSNHIPVQLVLAGIGPRMEEMKAMARKLNIQDNVYFVGHTTKTPELYYYSDINTLTSNSEAFGIVLLEGALMKKPLVGTKGTGMEGIIKHGETGLLFKAGDDQDLANQLKKLIDDPLLAQRLGQCAYDYATSNFLAKHGITRIAEFYAKVLGS